MRGEDLEAAHTARVPGAPSHAADTFPSAIPRAAPRSRFAEGLGAEIRQAARQQVTYEGGLPFEEMVVELRKLVRLLCETLVPVCARPEYTRALGDQLLAAGAELQVQRQRQRRLLMVGGVMGSILGVLTAFLLWRRQPVRAKKSVGAV